MSFAKACAKLRVKDKSAVAIMGFNAPEWVIAFTGGIVYNCVGTGIYSTNTPEACIYQVDHSEAEVVVVETVEMLNRFLRHDPDNKLKGVKAFVVYSDK